MNAIFVVLSVVTAKVVGQYCAQMTVWYGGPSAVWDGFKMTIEMEFLKLQQVLNEQRLVLTEDDDCLIELRANHEEIMASVTRLQRLVLPVLTECDGVTAAGEWRGNRPQGAA